MTREGAENVLVPFSIGAGRVAEDVADCHPQTEDGLADVGAMVSSCKANSESPVFIPFSKITSQNEGMNCSPARSAIIARAGPWTVLLAKSRNQKPTM